MALINCTECKAQISDKAKKCPKCGMPIVTKETFKCFECGTELEKGTKDCSNCGAEQEIKLDVTKEIIEEFQEVETLNTLVSIPVQKKKSKALMWTLISVAALAMIAIVAIVITIQSHPSAAEKTRMEAEARAKMDSLFNAANLAIPASQPAPAPPPPVEKTPEELRQELKDNEMQNPASYLSVRYTLDVKVHLLKESEDIVNGTVYNTATMATFKDVVLNVQFLTATNALLDTKQYTLYQYVSPNSSKGFQIKVVSPSGTKTIGVEIVSAGSE